MKISICLETRTALEEQKHLVPDTPKPTGGQGWLLDWQCQWFMVHLLALRGGFASRSLGQTSPVYSWHEKAAMKVQTFSSR